MEMSETIRCPKCWGIISGTPEHSADMPCTCWMDTIRETGDKIDVMGFANENDHLRNQCDELRKELEYWKLRCAAAEAWELARLKYEHGDAPIQECIEADKKWKEIKDKEPK